MNSTKFTILCIVLPLAAGIIALVAVSVWWRVMQPDEPCTGYCPKYDEVIGPPVR